jgi:hypothetical protein
MSLKFLNSNTALGGRVAVGISALVGPTGSMGLQGPMGGGTGGSGFQGPQGLIGIQGKTGSAGPQGQDGSNGISGGLTLFLDTVGGTYSGSPISGSLLTFPNQTTGTIISSSPQTNSTINIARFISATGSLPTNIILGGLWDMNLFATCGTATSDSHYWFSVSYVDGDGVSNRVNIATGSFSESTQILDMVSPYNNTIYVPTTSLPDTTKRLLIDVYVQSIGTNITTTLYTRGNTLSHVHTTLLSTQTLTGPQGGIGPQGPIGLGSSLPTGTYYGDYLYWTPSTTSYSVGSENVVVGQNAGATLQQINAVAIGLAAGTSLQGTGSVAIGRQTGQTSQGEYSVGIGYNAAGSNQKSKSISIGYVSGQTNQQSNSIAIGTSSGNINQMDYSIGIGFNAGSYAQNSYSIGLGPNAGQSSQGSGCIAIGYKAGNSGQLQTSIAIGDSAGFNAQGITAVAIGTTAGFTSQGNNAIAIGRNVGYSSQGINSIAIGNNAGVSNQGAYSIIINTTGTLNANTGGFYVNPIRLESSNYNLFYNPSTKEISYSTGGSGFQGAVGSTGSIGSTGAVGPTGPAGAGGSGTGQWISSTGGIIYYSSGSVGINKANPTGSLDVVGLVSMSGSLNITGNISYTTTGSLINPTLQNYRETVNIGTSSTSSYVINCSTGNNFNITLATATTAFTFINVAPTGTLSNITLFLTQDNSGGRLATFPSSVSWGNPSTPVLSTAGNAIDILSFSTFTGGSKWFGFMSGRGF